MAKKTTLVLRYWHAIVYIRWHRVIILFISLTLSQLLLNEYDFKGHRRMQILRLEIQTY